MGWGREAVEWRGQGVKGRGWRERVTGVEGEGVGGRVGWGRG